MDPMHRKWTCRICGRSIATPSTSDDAVLCEDCTNEGEAQRRRVVDRLTRPYGAARELASGSEDHANLDWILGTRRNLDRNGSTLDREMAQLALLWLHDLARELDGHLAAETSGSPDHRSEVAHSLRVATRDFAEAFLTPLESVEPS